MTGWAIVDAVDVDRTRRALVDRALRFAERELDLPMQRLLWVRPVAADDPTAAYTSDVPTTQGWVLASDPNGMTDAIFLVDAPWAEFVVLHEARHVDQIDHGYHEDDFEADARRWAAWAFPRVFGVQYARAFVDDQRRQGLP